MNKYFRPLLFMLALLACKKNPLVPPGPAPVPPGISNISPATGPAGVSVTINGLDFDPAAANNTVKFNGTAATVTAASATALTVTAPAAGTSGAVTVTTSAGTATGPVFTYTVVPPPPTLSALSPTSGPAGTVVTLTGTNFKTVLTDNTVKFNGTAATVTAATATTLTVTAPPAGTTGAVTVSTADGNATGPVFTYTVATAVYVAGDGITGPGYWKNGVFTAAPADCFRASCIAVSGTDIYLGGTATNYLPRYWKNGIGVSPAMTPTHNEGVVAGLALSGTDVWASGGDDINSAQSVAHSWKNGADVPLTFTGITQGHGNFVSGTDVYVAGTQFPFSGNGSAVVWKNGAPTYLTDGSTMAEAYSVFVSAAGDVYVAGYEGVTAKYWKNGVAVSLATPAPYSAVARGVYVDGTDVYVAGYYRDVAKYWKNGVMVDLTATAYGHIGYESTIGITGKGSDVYIVGNDLSKGYGYWKNGVFTVLPGAQYAYGIVVQ